MKLSVLAKQMVERQRAAFNACYNSMVIFQAHWEKIMGTTANSGMGIPVFGREACQNAFQEYKSGMGNFKKLVDDGFDRMESFLR